ncbi:MAG: Spy/CpxP family protein refolding chaperone [Bacteroidales bacterium]|nr:MAG: Spy/CpxP family protein refolding chaperone [Bacteroidales bacterium]
MKRFGSIVLVTFMSIGLSAYSQQGQQFRGGVGKNPDKIGNADCKIPNLTDEQQQKINDLRVKHINDVTPLKNELGEKRARMRTLQSAEKPDLNAINKLIDEMAAVRAQIQKKAAAHKVEVASLLTDEQKVYFNAHQGRKFDKGMKRGGGRHGMGNGRGPGYCGYNIQN